MLYTVSHCAGHVIGSTRPLVHTHASSLPCGGSADPTRGGENVSRDPELPTISSNRSRASSITFVSATSRANSTVDLKVCVHVCVMGGVKHKPL